MNFLAHPIVFKSIEHPLLRNCQLIWKLKSVKESFFYFDLLSSKIVDSADMGCVYVCVGCIVCTCVCVCVCVSSVCFKQEPASPGSIHYRGYSERSNYVSF